MNTNKVIINGERFIISDKHILIGKNDIEYKGIIDSDGYLVGYLKKEALNYIKTVKFNLFKIFRKFF